ncbi:hypothetical protein GWK47_034285 [Chionoecetes opilio]|uniref:Uncharacterized protein n=1 Tax=Chionoecetes opilio TaxID=41210 RepID=A0A8J5D0S9_CHIOP|nr:hypothetical protein GWK47_034285 [Chionoecetes opilio]
MASHLCTRQDPSRPHLPQARCSQLGPTRHSPGRQKNTPPGVSQHSRGGVRLWPHIHQPRQEGRQGCCLETELHPTRRAPSGRSGSRHTLQVTSPLPDGILAPRMVLLPPSYLGLLDRVQARAQRLARLKAPEAAAQIIQPLQQRRDMAGMCVMYKAHRMQLLQLTELRLNPRARPSHSTRASHNIDHQVTVPFARTEHYLRSFLPSYGRLWNTLVRQTDLHLTTSLHAFKSDVNAWLQAELTQ